MLATGASASAADCGPVDTQVTGLSQGQMETSIGCLINNERSSFGLRPVRPNADLRQAALSHSNEMVDEGYFEHTSPSGLTFIQRIDATGYLRGARSWVVGENLVWGTGSLGTPRALVDAWMNSPPHRENLLRPTFSEIGIAAVDGTPLSKSDLAGVTVSSEYGYRSFGGSKKADARKAKARKAKARRAKHRRALR